MEPILLSAIIVFALNAAGYTIGFFWQTDKLTDLLYSVSFGVAALVLWLLEGQSSMPATVLTALVVLWALRLGAYLFRRILHMGHDARFNDMRPNAIRLAGFWSLQAITVWIVLLPLPLVLQTSTTDISGQPFFILGLAIWLLGMVIEAVADQQKFSFKQAQPDQFMRTGLWAYSRHPNYLGEIILWIGLALVASPFLSGWALALAWLSPLWITLLLLQVSGIPLLEKSADKRYGDKPEYQAYKAKTALLIPGIW